MENKNVVLYERKGHIAIITLNRPEKLNAMNREVVAGLNQAWDVFSEDEEARVAVLTSACEKAFCAGADLHELSSHNPIVLAPAMPGVGIEIWKPIVAAVSGYCLGAGMVLAMFTDMRIAADNAYFGYPEAKVGVAGGLGPAMTRYMPMGIALEILLTGEMINAQRAYEVGFVNRVVPANKLMEQAIKTAEGIAGNAPLVLTALKK